ncbi:hypothetical protein BGP78_21975 [Pseudoalteromonas sp. MSK9-3]|uniref:HNH endonuclease n=1 Tax=Pseudoalteromonas sp. MSK9-3 TaxID=1897633 RepID=UPI000E6B8895|nr:HNH endonuclease [Pseudoalteromonas sp. MSK9-3]RJE71147.1 hypothetical protein BGP78_21975 [Pseudoalteromonas sp. MSK9-3]
MTKFNGFRSSWYEVLGNVRESVDRKILFNYRRDPGFFKDGRPVFAYKKEFQIARYDELTADNIMSKTPKVHLTYCQNIQRAPGKYQVTSRADGFFHVNLKTESGEIQKEEVLLPMAACQFCIRMLFPDYLPPLGKNKTKCDELASNFNFADFVSEGVVLSHIAFDESNILNRFLGERNWSEFSRDMRAKNNWCCQFCKISFKSYKHLLHVHHINHSQYWNSPANCMVLCIGCHAKQPHHQHLKQNKLYSLYEEYIKKVTLTY